MSTRSTRQRRIQSHVVLATIWLLLKRDFTEGMERREKWIGEW
jgi:hypothetical protein